MSKGFLVYASNNEKTDYLKMAYLQAMSIKLTQSVNKYALVIRPGDVIPDKYKQVFDYIEEVNFDFTDILMPEQSKRYKKQYGTYATEYKGVPSFVNEGTLVHSSPFDEFIKLDSDMLFLEDMSYWWDIEKPANVYICSSVRTYRGTEFKTNYYRNIFVKNNIPNTYSALTYFRDSKETHEFFSVVNEILYNWDDVIWDMTDSTEPCISTDVAYGLAVKMLNKYEYLADNSGFTFVHMKPKGQYFYTFVRDQWTRNVKYNISNNLELFVGNIKQSLPFHYIETEFVTDKIISKYEKELGI